MMWDELETAALPSVLEWSEDEPSGTCSPLVNISSTVCIDTQGLAPVHVQSRRNVLKIQLAQA